MIDPNQIPLVYLFLPLLLINLITYDTYKSDKEKAKSKEWRISEAALHFWELIGGWPAALLEQHKFRHKCSKGSFQATYWIIVVLHIYLAIDYIFNLSGQTQSCVCRDTYLHSLDQS